MQGRFSLSNVHLRKWPILGAYLTSSHFHMNMLNTIVFTGQFQPYIASKCKKYYRRTV